MNFDVSTEILYDVIVDYDDEHGDGSFKKLSHEDQLKVIEEYQNHDD